MAFIPPPHRRGRERIVAYGDSKAGKSFCWIDIMRECHKRGNTGIWHIIDTDDAVADMFDELFPELEEMAIVYNCDTYEEIVEASQAVQKAKPNARDGDWVVIDMIDEWWEEVKSYYIRKVFGMDPEEYLLETSTLVHIAKEAQKGSDRDFGGFATEEWAQMRKLYMAVEKPLTVNGKAHVFAVTGESSLNPYAKGPKAKAEIKDLGHIGFKPRGQNTMRHRFRTVLRVSRPGQSRECQMAGDRYRENRWKEKHDGDTFDLGDIFEGEAAFVRNYMKPIASWRVER